jgi:hypothetical protein
MPLTDIAIKNAKPKDKKYRLRDSDKLFLEIYPNGVKGWRVRYRRNGKEREICLGNYPAVSLKDARKRRDESNEMLAFGRDPIEEKALGKRASEIAGMTFRDAFDKWLAAQTIPSWSGDQGKKLVARVSKYLLTHLGHVPLPNITPASVLTIINDWKVRNTTAWPAGYSGRHPASCDSQSRTGG